MVGNLVGHGNTLPGCHDRSELLQLLDFSQDFLGIKEPGPRFDRLSVFIQQHCGWLAGDPEVVPAVKGGVPVHADGFDLVAFHEIFCLFDVVLGSDANDGDDLCMSSSKLLETGGFPVTCASMRGPEPRQGG